MLCSVHERKVLTASLKWLLKIKDLTSILYLTWKYFENLEQQNTELQFTYKGNLIYITICEI